MTRHPIGTARTVFGAAAMVVSSVMPIALLAAFAVRIESTLGISDAQVGAALSVFFGVSVLIAVPGGRLADKLGPTRALVLAASLTTVALLGSAVVARSYPALLAFFLVGGLGQAVAAPTSNVILAAGVRTERIGLAMGIKQASVPLGAFIAGMAVALIDPDVSWRVPFALAVFIPAVAVVNMLTVGPPASPVQSGSAGRNAVSVRHMWRFPVAGGLSTFAASAITGFVVLGLVDGGLLESTAGVVLTIAGIGSVTVRVASGYLKDRFQFASSHAVVFLLVCGAFGFLLLVSGWGILVPVGAVVAFSAGWGWPAMFQLSLVETFPATPGSATGIARLGLAGGNAVGPLVFGIVFQTAGYRVGWALAGVCMIGAALAVRIAARHTAASTPS